jgi:hypothetical protein
VIAYYKKGVTNLKLLEKNHEADAHTIANLMAYVDKLADTQDAVVHDFKGEDHNDGGGRSRKQSGEVYATDPPRPSTFLEGDFNKVMDNQCQFHCDAKHTMRECEQLKRTPGYLQSPRRPRAATTTTRTAVVAPTTSTIDLIDVITTTADPTIAMTIGIVVIITATITVMIDMINLVATIDVMPTTVMIVETTTATMSAVMTGMPIVAQTTTTAMTTITKSLPLRHHQKGAIQTVRSRTPTCQLHHWWPLGS